MERRKYFYLGIIGILAVATVLVADYAHLLPSQKGPQERPTTLIFKLKNDYSGNYVGAINCYNEDSRCRSFGTFELFDYCYNQIISNWECVGNEITGEEECHCGYGNPPGESIETCEPTIKNHCVNWYKGPGVPNIYGYYLRAVPNSEALVKRFAIFDKSIITKAIDSNNRLESFPEDFPNGIMPGMGDSMEMPKDEFYSYVIDEHPLAEAYFCNLKETYPPGADLPVTNLASILSDLSQGRIPAECEKII